MKPVNAAYILFIGIWTILALLIPENNNTPGWVGIPIGLCLGTIILWFCYWNYHPKHNIIDIREREPIIKEDTRITLGKAEATQMELFLFSQGYTIEQVNKEMSNYKRI